MRYRFDSFVIDTELFELKKDGVVVPLQRRAFDLLVHLVEHRDRVATRVEILEHVWPDVVVSEAAVAQAMLVLRRALADDDEAPRYVQTVRGRGYRFVGRLEGDAPAEPERAAPRAEPPRDPARGDDLVPFVGHAAALDAALEVAVAARARRAAVLLVTGASGSGKTRLLEEVARRSPDVRFVIGRAYRADASPLLPIRRIRFELDPSEDVSSDADPQRAFESLARSLSGRRSPPLALVLDDLHLADGATRDVLALLAPSLDALGVPLVVTYPTPATSAPGLGEVVGHLSRPTFARSVVLAPLGEAEIADAAGRIAGRPLSPAVIDLLVRKTGGNPRLLAQLAHVLRRGAALHVDSGTSTLLGAVPLKDALLVHVTALPAPTRETLAVAAVLGETFGVGPLSDVLDLSREATLERLAPARAEGVIGVVPGELGQLRFAHGLVRDALLRALPDAERARLHGAVAHALVRYAGPAAEDAQAAAIAAHYAEAALTGDVGVAVRYALLAADHDAAQGNAAAALVRC
ncbi:MAG: winged helix-turn-helix domain-containing protein, partial [Myxococcales bacterium]|nr:winged helix-turn-helix domain-containing protein [Myxococcales bacterium]